MRMSNISRRDFLQKSSLTVGAAGVLSAVPMLAGMPAAGAAVAGKSARTTAVAERSDRKSSKNEQIVARVRDLDAGEIDIYVGTRRVSTTDRRLAARIAEAAR
jgi:nitrous oxide reductase